jgi:2-amino-4-hydroxy-6-hydroxymethyldihydropteridine diphosphokinase
LLSPVFIALGSNIEPEKNLPRAVRRLAGRFRVQAVSRVYRTAPLGLTAQADFLNAAALIETDLSPLALKYDVLRPIEASLGRIRGADKNAPRTIDLDIALYGDLILDDPAHRITIPDPDIITRAHLALPLADLAPDFVHPLAGRTLSEIAARFADHPGVTLHALTLTPEILRKKELFP